MLERKSEEKLKNLDYRGAINALRRAEKYISNKKNPNQNEF